MKKLKEFSEITKVEYPQGIVDEKGIEEVTKILIAHSVPEDIASAVVEETGNEYVNGQGTFTKRLAKKLKAKQIQVPNDVFGTIGSIVHEYCEREEYYIKIHFGRIWWQDGEFGDRGSCFWGGRAAAKDMIEDCGAGAVLFYKKFEDFVGYGRCWIWPIYHGHIIFNVYSKDGGLSLLRCARLLSHLLGATYTKISLYGIEPLYINNDLGYIIHNFDEEVRESYTIGEEGYDEDSEY